MVYIGVITYLPFTNFLGRPSGGNHLFFPSIFPGATGEIAVGKATVGGAGEKAQEDTGIGTAVGIQRKIAAENLPSNISRGLEVQLMKKTL